MTKNYFENIPASSGNWLSSLSLEECNDLKQWLKKRIKYLKTIPFIKKKIEELDLSTRAYNALKLHDLLTVEDIVRLGFDNIGRIRNIGSKTVDEIKEAVAH